MKIFLYSCTHFKPSAMEKEANVKNFNKVHNVKILQWTKINLPSKIDKI